MKTLFVFLILSILGWSHTSEAFNFNCIKKNMTTAPSPKTYKDSDGNEHDTDAWKAWKDAHSDWAARQNWGCCDKLVHNSSTRVCEDKSLQDDTLKQCKNHGE